jgi:hypothetical protein
MLKDTLNKGISTPIAIGIILILVVAVGGFTWLQYGEMWREASELPEIELPEKEKIEDETADWKTYYTEKFSFKYSDNIWQSGDKDLYEDYGKISYKQKEAYFINKQIENCEGWLGIDVGEGICETIVYALSSKCGDDEVVECQGPIIIEWKKKIDLNDDFFAEREIKGSSFEGRNQSWYEIYDQKSNDVYCATLITLPDNQKQKLMDEFFPQTFAIQECLDSFEQILKTLRFK